MSDTDFPDAIFEIKDDSLARKFLADHNVIHELPRPLRLSQTAVSSLYDGHVSHWIVISRYEGYALSTDNGLHVLCIPKRLATHEKVLAGMKHSLERKNMN